MRELICVDLLAMIYGIIHLQDLDLILKITASALIIIVNISVLLPKFINYIKTKNKKNEN